MNKNSPTRTVLTIVIGFLILHLLFQHQWLMYVAATVGLLGLTSTYLAQKIDFIWMKLGWLLSLIVPKIILGVVFFFILTPIALLYRAFKKDKAFKLKRSQKTVFVTTDKIFLKESFERMF
ncbi:MAG TPA: hypothetical protein EYG86_00085 [Crocinitomicaceae bacterium]|nr:hypothetical protein [Crocinitomicaceae bacterium]